MVIASSIPVVFSAGADIKAFTQMDEAGGEELIDTGHALLRELGQSRVSTIAAVNALALRRRLRAGDGLRLPDRRRVGRLRPAGDQARDHPRLRRHPAPAAAGRRRQGAGDEPDRRRDLAPARRCEYGLANRVVPDHELFDTALAWARKLAGQAPIAVEQIKQVSDKGDLDEGIEAEKAGLRQGVHRPRTRKEGISAFLGKRTPEVAGQVSDARPRRTQRLAELIRASPSATVALTGAGISVPSGIPDFRTPGQGLWEKVDPMEVAHIDAFHRDPARFWELLPAALRDARRQASRTRRHEALAELERRGLLEARHHPEHRPPPRRGGLASG